ncbi:MAG TPA: DUF4870 domain-containing protein [Chitinophagaceae bacterium]|nr:DUF4870 domain-containing protein [Chitinophagaceae bacterium]HAN38703.1 DUF4870 domain-containing protein [Chitinophagaceae bacterium]
MEATDIIYQEDKPATQDERTTALLSHILTFVVGFFAPLIIYLLKKDESNFVRAHARESLNFQISIIIYSMISFVLIFALFVGVLGFIVIGILYVITVIIATIKASEGKHYRYPMCIRIIK